MGGREGSHRSKLLSLTEPQSWSICDIDSAVSLYLASSLAPPPFRAASARPRAPGAQSGRPPRAPLADSRRRARRGGTAPITRGPGAASPGRR